MSKTKGEDKVIVSGIVNGCKAVVQFLKKFVKNKE
jgi:hypothetical protein